MSDLGKVYEKIEDGFKDLNTKIDANFKEFTDRMSATELKVALIENRQKPDPICLKSIDSEIKKYRLPRWVAGLLVVLLLGSFGFPITIFIWHREDMESINTKVEILSQHKEP